MSETWPRFQSLPKDSALWLLTWLDTAVLCLTGEGWTMTPAGASPIDDAGRVPAFPIVGEVAAGEPTLAEQHIEGYAAHRVPHQPHLHPLLACLTSGRLDLVEDPCWALARAELAPS